ncbi:hypothetical protein [Streptomyces sp. NPDC050600]|uniref:hypothetical protein n=1 Tax=Streptomyces sp. NPDC050600 TaxID=3157213 RepID=UPI0034259A09
MDAADAQVGARTTAAGSPSPGRAARRTAAALAVAAAAVLSSGCGADAARVDGARRAASAFEASLARADYAGACALLAPETRRQLEDDTGRRCGPALAGEKPPAAGTVRGTQVYGRQALLTLERDTLFLSQFDDGWKVAAAGCARESGRPYRCSLKGG